MAECTIYDKLRYIAETKDLIKTAIETQDVEVLESDTFRKYAEYITEIRKVASVNGETGDIILKTINGKNLVGEGNIVIQGGEGGDVDLTNYYTKEETYSKDEVNDLLENSGGGVVTETDPIFTSWKDDDSIVIGKNAVNGMTNFGILMEKNNVVVIGNSAKVQVDNGVAIGNGATVLNGAIGGVAIGTNASVDAAYTTNINNVLKGDASKNAYIRDSNGNYTKILDLINNAGGGSEPEQYVKTVTTDNVGSIFINNNDGTSDRIVFPLINGQNIVNNGGNIETDLSDYYTKGEVYNKNEVNELIDEVNAGDVDLTNYYTKQEVDDKIPSLNGYATEQWVEDKNYLTEHQSLEDYAKKTDIPDVSEFIKEIPSEYITEEELNGKGYLTSIPDTYVTDGELSTAISDKVSQTALNEAIEGVENKIPSLDGYATEQWVEDKKYLTEHQDLTEYAKKSELPSVEGLASEQWVNQQGFLKEHQSLEDYAKKSDIPTIPTSNTAFTNDAGYITLSEVPETDLSNYYTKEQTYSKDEVDGLLENSGDSSGVNKIILGDADYGWNTYKGDIKLNTGFTQFDEGDVGYDVSIGGTDVNGNETGTMWFGFRSTDGSLLLEDGGGRIDLKVNPDILGGGTAGVEAINIGRDVQDWTQKTGIVSLYTQMYDGGYEVSADGMSFFGIKPADDTIIIEQGGGTANGCFRGTIRVNPDVLGGGSGNAPTLQEGKSGTTDNYIYSDGDQNSNNCVLASVSLDKSVNANQVGITQNVKLWGDSSFNGKDAITIYGASETYAGVMTAEDKKNLDALVANSGNTGGSDLISINANNSSDSLNVGSGNTGDLYGTILVGRNINNNINASVLIGNGVSNTVGDRTNMAVNICNSLMADSSGNMYFWKNGKVEKLADYAVYKEWSGTQAEYNALGTYDDNTIYNIIEG